MYGLESLYFNLHDGYLGESLGILGVVLCKESFTFPPCLDFLPSTGLSPRAFSQIAS